jgi:hypothetical protein
MPTNRANDWPSEQGNDRPHTAEAESNPRHIAAANEIHQLTSRAHSFALAEDTLQSKIKRLTASQKRAIARQLGYDSSDALLAASMVMTLGDGSAWCLTLDRSGIWAAWNVYAIDLPRRSKTQEKAPAAIHASHN